MTEHRIRTTMRPDLPVWVSDTELVDLERMGVVHSLAPFTLDDVPPPLPSLRDDEPESEQEDATDGEEIDHGEGPQEATGQ